jgi:GAF domain
LSDHLDAPSVRISDSGMFVNDTVSRVFISETVSNLLEGDITLEITLRRLAVLANETISGSDMAAANTMVAGRPRTAGVTDDLASEVDDLQYRPGAGPCLDAVRDQTVVRVDSTETDQRWPAFSLAAAAKGSLSFPPVVHHQGIGALNCYSRIAAGFSADDECVGSTIAVAAAIALAYWDARHPVEGLGPAVPSRPTT